MSAKLLKKTRFAPAAYVAYGISRRSARPIGVIFLLFSRMLAARSADIAWHAPKECGSSEDFENNVARIVGKPLAELDSSSWGRADVSIRYEEAVWQVLVVVESKNSAARERKVTTGSCNEALQAAELIVATSLYSTETEAVPASNSSDRSAPPKAVDHQSALQSAVPSSTATLPPPLVSKPEAQLSSPATTRSLDPPLSWRTSGGARVGTDAFLFPSLAEAAWLTLELRNHRYGAELMLGAARSSSGLDRGGSVAATLLSAALVGCRSSGRSALRLAACAGAELGIFRANSRGLPDVIPRTTNALWSAALIQGEASWQIAPRFAFIAAVEGAAAFRRMAVGVVGSPKYGTLYETGRLDLRPSVGLQARF